MIHQTIIKVRKGDTEIEIKISDSPISSTLAKIVKIAVDELNNIKSNEAT